MPLPLSLPVKVLALARTTAGQVASSATDTVGRVTGHTMQLVGQAGQLAAEYAAVPGRAFAVLDEIESLVRRTGTVVDHVELLLERSAQVVDETEEATRRVEVIAAAATSAVEAATRLAAAAETLLGDADQVAVGASRLVGQSEQIAARSADLLGEYEPALRRGAPMARHFVEQLSEDEVDAAVKLVDELPRLTRHIQADVLPILATLDRVGPDIHSLLEVTRDLKLAVAGIPGLRMLRRRGADRLGEEEEPAANDSA
ncbi:hypothetical protein O7632_25100 [Solwaraspora sp. WMMD406]|uniref:hypothetical protein n=1 Tax=Solwaraspora sp. WMMD406 TaxID=3016095 RepID=UPI002417DC2E|nr:hypothetical protein [Solwaraspora sp. WMMD406]MDG4767343.1 hypothetical protein [Solwaraspora sp. WMMD406]